MRCHTVVLSPQPAGSAFHVTVPALPGCFAWGATDEKALEMARDATATDPEGEAPPSSIDGAIAATVEIDGPVAVPA